LKHLAKVSGREMAMSCGCGKQWVWLGLCINLSNHKHGQLGALWPSLSKTNPIAWGSLQKQSTESPAGGGQRLQELTVSHRNLLLSRVWKWDTLGG
jgi:hypothetical protein